jgi:membrane fusion protein (multidrug efflux system)
MKIQRRTLYWVMAFTFVLFTFWYAYAHSYDETKVKRAKVPVEVDVVTRGSIEETMELTGWVRANNIVAVTSKVAGRVESLELVLQGSNTVVPVEEGLEVKKGQQIAVIDHDVYLAQLAAAQAIVRAREVELADAEREKKRVVSLYESGSVTEQNKDKVVTASELAAASLSLAKANLELAQINLRESIIVSPIDGIIITKHIDAGNMIGQGQPIVTVADIKTIKVMLAFAERYADEIKAEMPIKLKVDAYGQREFDARVYSVYPALDPQTHTVKAEIRFNNDELLLKPGMFARITLVTQQKDDVVVIDRDVILGGKINEPYVYVVEDGIAKKRFVEVGITESARCEIVKGLKKGETLVVNGMHYLTDDIEVEVVRIEDIK